MYSTHVFSHLFTLTFRENSVKNSAIDNLFAYSYRHTLKQSSSFVQFWYVCMSGICLTSVTKSFGSIFEIFMKNKNRWRLWRKISENDPAYQFLQITTSVSLYLKVYFLQFLLWKWSVILRMTDIPMYSMSLFNTYVYYPRPKKHFFL